MGYGKKLKKNDVGNNCGPGCLDNGFCPIGTSLEDGGLLHSKRRKDTPKLQENLEVMKYMDIFVIREAITEQTLPVFVKTLQNHLHFIAGFMGLEAPGLVPCKDCRILLQATLKMGRQGRFVAEATCLHSLRPSTPPMGPWRAEGPRICSLGSRQHNASPICCSSLELPSASGSWLLMIPTALKESLY